MFRVFVWLLLGTSCCVYIAMCVFSKRGLERAERKLNSYLSMCPVREKEGEIKRAEREGGEEREGEREREREICVELAVLTIKSATMFGHSKKCLIHTLLPTPQHTCKKDTVLCES